MMKIPTYRLKLYRQLAGVLSPRGKRAALSILIYHRVIPEPDWLLPTEMDAATFAWQISVLNACFNVLPLPEAVERLTTHTLPERAACITFDDGYADNLTVAAPILIKHGIPATCFIATDYLDGGRMFNDTIVESMRRTQATTIDLRAYGADQYDLSSITHKTAAIHAITAHVKYLPAPQRLAHTNQIAALLTSEPLPTDLMLTSAQVQQLAQLGMTIGAHTASHPILTRLSLAQVQTDIQRGRERLETILKTPIQLFAYPNGRPNTDYTAEHVALIKTLGFKAAVTTAWGCACATTDHCQLPRFTPWARQPERFIQQLIRNFMQRPATCTQP